MKQLEEKLSSIEKEINELKLVVIQQSMIKTKVSLKSSLKGVKIGEDKIEEAKKSMFKSGA
jgi:hypothetical protein